VYYMTYHILCHDLYHLEAPRLILEEGPTTVQLAKFTFLPGLSNAAYGPATSGHMTERLGIGPHAMWGFTPALDLLEAYLKHHPHQDAEGSAVGEQPINVLLVNPNDIRHVLRTISTRSRHFAGETGKRARPVHVSVDEH
jgi:hypothetical protein